MNYVKAVVDFITTDPDLSPLVGDRVEFVRTQEEYNEPFIVFTEGAFDNWWDWWSGDGAPDFISVIFDIIVGYEDFIVGRRIRDLLINKLNGFVWELTPDFRGNIVWERNEEVLYNQQTNKIALQSTYTFKTKTDI